MKQTCTYCKRHAAKGGGATIDHVIPMSKGGSTHKHNTLIACYECNQFKADKMPWVWLHEIEILLKYGASPTKPSYRMETLGQIKKTLQKITQTPKPSQEENEKL